MRSAFTELKGHVSPRFISLLLCSTGSEKAARVALNSRGGGGGGGRAGGGGDAAQAAFPIYQQGGGYTNN